MSEPGHVLTMSGIAIGRSMFEGAQIHSIQGGNFYNVHGHATFHNTTHVHSSAAGSNLTLDDQINEVVCKLEALAANKVEFGAIHEEIVDKQANNTYRRLRARQQVQSWMNSRHKCLWIKGGPGSGKTYLAAAFVQWGEIAAQQRSQQDMAVIFAYLRYTEKLTAWDVILSLVIQLVQYSQELPIIVDMVNAAFQRNRRRKGKPSFDELVQLLKAIVDKFATVWIVIDGLDELSEELQWVIIEAMASVDAQVVFTSRPLKLLEEKFQGLVGERVSFMDFTADPEDLDAFITSIIQRTPHLDKLLEVHGIRKQVLDAIKRNASGMFLHASLQVDLLQHCRTLHDVREVMAHVPPKLEDLYAKTLKRIPIEDSALARRVLVWLVHTNGVITLEDLQYAIAVDLQTYEHDPARVVSEEDILSVCRGLITIESQTRYVRLIHMTAYESLLQLLADYKPAAHEMVASTCMARLVECGLQKTTCVTAAEFRDTLAAHPLLEYSYWNADHHTRLSIDSNASLRATVEHFILNCEAFPYIIGTEEGAGDGEYINLLEPLHVATIFGMRDLVKHMVVVDGVDVNLRARHPSGQGWTSLIIAATERDAGMVEVLLSLPGVDANLVDDWDYTPLHIACSEGREAVAMKLLDFPGCDVNKLNKHGSTPLLIAADYGMTVVVSRLLAMPEVDVNHRSAHGNTALTLAIAAGSEATVSTLLNVSEVDINETNQDGNTPLIFAVMHEQVEIVELLLAVPGIKVNHQNNYGVSALFLAAMYGYEDIVEVLSEVPGIDPNQYAQDDNTPLVYAARYGYRGVLDILMSIPGIDINQKNGEGNTALLVAFLNERTSIVKTLSHLPGVDIHASNNNGDNLFMHACAKGDVALVQWLMQVPGTDVNHSNSVGATALMTAAANGHHQVVELLVKTPDIALNSQDKWGNTALILASLRGHVAVVRTLLGSPGVDVHLGNEQGNPPLLLAASRGHTQIVQVLLNVPGIQVNQRNQHGGSPLMYASHKGHFDVVKILLNTPGIDVNAVDNTESSSLVFAASFGYTDILKALLGVRGVEVNRRTAEGWTAAMRAAYRGHLPALKLLVEFLGIDLAVVTPGGETILLFALSYHLMKHHLEATHRKDLDPEVVALFLLELPVVRGLADVPDQEGKTPLMVASMFGYQRVVDRLLGVCGVDVHKVSKNMKTALGLAKESKHRAVVETLLRAGAVDIT